MLEDISNLLDSEFRQYVNWKKLIFTSLEQDVEISITILMINFFYKRYYET